MTIFSSEATITVEIKSRLHILIDDCNNSKAGLLIIHVIMNKTHKQPFYLDLANKHKLVLFVSQ